jgi:drug/metabolite transporter (DMT)-like permease
MRNQTTSSTPPLWGLVAAFAAIYLIWGSTYLGIRFAIETIPPFLMSGSRNLVAGVLLIIFARSRGAAAPSRVEWFHAAIAGGLMVALGNGCVTWAEQMIPSGQAALLVALTPAWMVLFDWLRPGGTRPGTRVIAGISVGFVGVALLAQNHDSGRNAAYGWGVVALLASSLGWSLGSIFNRSARKPASPFLAVGMQMLTGSVWLLVMALARGETAEFSFAQVTLRSFGAWLYLMLAGSIIAYTAYVWLLHATSPAQVATSAYVNPLIAVLLGCTLGREVFSQVMLLAGALIIVAVVLIVRGAGSRAPTAKPVAVCEDAA